MERERVEVGIRRVRERGDRGFLRPLRCFDAPGGILHLQAHDHHSWSVMAIQKEEGGIY